MEVTVCAVLGCELRRSRRNARQAWSSKYERSSLRIPSTKARFPRRGHSGVQKFQKPLLSNEIRDCFDCQSSSVFPRDIGAKLLKTQPASWRNGPRKQSRSRSLSLYSIYFDQNSNPSWSPPQGGLAMSSSLSSSAQGPGSGASYPGQTSTHLFSKRKAEKVS